MNTTSEPLTPELQAWLEAWRTCTQNVLSQVSSQTIAFEISSDPLPPSDSDLYYTVASQGAISGEMALRIPASSALRLAQKFLGETEPATDLSAERKQALEELLRQIAGLAGTALAPAGGGEVKLALASSPAPSWPPAASVCLRTRDEAGETVVFEIQISAALSSSLTSGARKAPAEAAPTVDAAPPPLPTVAPPPAQYGRLLDVGLDVKLRFGTRRMQLRDVLALSSGFVVELDNKVQSPADLLLDGRVIARGEVVVVDGKYGLRITEIPDAPPFPEVDKRG